jgi:hypothetical protein
LQTTLAAGSGLICLLRVSAVAETAQDALHLSCDTAVPGGPQGPQIASTAAHHPNVAFWMSRHKPSIAADTGRSRLGTHLLYVFISCLWSPGYVLQCQLTRFTQEELLTLQLWALQLLALH